MQADIRVVEHARCDRRHGTPNAEQQQAEIKMAHRRTHGDHALFANQRRAMAKHTALNPTSHAKCPATFDHG